MSRVGKNPIQIPDKVKIDFKDPLLEVSGPNGALNMRVVPHVKLEIDDNEIRVTPKDNHRKTRAMHGLMRSLINNMVTGVSQGFQKSLEIQGVGYRAETDGKTLTLNVGYSHPVLIPTPEGLTIEVEKNNIVHVKGIDKQRVGEMAARIRRVRKPEPYGGKGIRYVGEQVRRKVGKAGAK
jgi:large subunit ribosomal protein L6